MAKLRPQLIKEPQAFSFKTDNYDSLLVSALNWYNSEKEKKEGHAFLRNYIITNRGREPLIIYDKIPLSKITSTYMWLGQLWNNGTRFSPKHQEKLDGYIDELLKFEVPQTVELDTKAPRPTIQDLIKEKSIELLGELEGEFDSLVFDGVELDLYKYLQTRSIPSAYCQYIEPWINQKSTEFVFVYDTNDDQIKEGYSHLNKRQITKIIRVLGEWKKSLELYSGYKKANRKPRAKKEKSPGQQVAKLKFKKDDTELKLTSISPTEIVGALQVWVYNTKYKRLSVYRTDSSRGIQIKGTSLQNYEPDLCEQKTLRKPEQTIKDVLSGGKIQLRKLMSTLTTKSTTVNGRINEDCILLRAIK